MVMLQPSDVPFFPWMTGGVLSGRRPMSSPSPNLPRKLNDALRTTLLGGELVITLPIAGLAVAERRAILKALREYDDFTAEKDPRGEHDSGSFELDMVRYIWRIEVRSASTLDNLSSPVEPDGTVRVLAIMCAFEV